MLERRKFVRFPSATIMQYKGGIFKAQSDVVTKDVSLGGVCFFSDDRIKPGTTLKIRLYYDVKAPAKIVKGKVIWSQKCLDGSRGYINGFCFTR